MRFPALLVLLCIALVDAMKDQDFIKCRDSGFCTRNRAYAESMNGRQPSDSPYRVVESSVQLAAGLVTADLLNTRDQVVLLLSLFIYEDGIVRVRIDEKNAPRKRYDVKNVLIDEGIEYDDDIVLISIGESLKSAPYENTKTSDTLKLSIGKNAVHLHYAPFALDFYEDGVLVSTVNRKGYFNFEHHRPKPQPVAEVPPVNPDAMPVPPTEDAEAAADETTATSGPDPNALNARLEASMWEEKFRDFTDTKKYGPNSFGVDVSFPGSQHVYGLPEHATNLSLKETTGAEGAYKDPYRLYNLDVFEYELDREVALYGAVPLMWSHKMTKQGSRTVGFFWLNAAETWVDVKKETTVSQLFFQWGLFGSKDPHDATTTITHWVSESGVLDFFVLFGPQPADVFRQYAILTGSQNLPQLFALGYHQCRWNYHDHEDVELVHNGFETNNIPLDVIWLDIEHTEDKKYFTWHGTKFNEPVKMQQLIASHGRKMVTIIDPHIKRDDGYHVKSQASEKGLFVRNKDGGEYEGWCWPGSSSWIDFLNPEARQFWCRLYAHDAYQGSTETLFTWNDMNEPSVFNGPEITMPKDNLHYQDVEHREVHNIYGMMLHRATYSGHVYRSLPNGEISYALWTNRTSLTDGPNPHRPFVLSRAFFAGTQRYGAIWTGDNTATWEQLEMSPAMLLAVSLGGIGFCGADVGGFFGNPSAELLTRWYQAGVYYPFFRGHAHLDTKRREPWIFGDPYTGYIRDAIVLRYRLLPYWYTLFRRGQIDGITPIRPFFIEFPTDAKTFGMDDSYMVGDALLVKPVGKPLDQGGDHVDVYLPGNEIWFNFFSHIGYSPQNRVHRLQTPLASPVPALLRAGKVVVTRDRVRRSSQLMHHDPLSLLIGLDSKNTAAGEWYLDDGESFSYALKNEFVHKAVTVKTEGATKFIIQARDIVYDPTSKSRRMKPWQRPFLSDPVQNDKGQLLKFEDIERVMSLSSAHPYCVKINQQVSIERVTILGQESSILSTLFANQPRLKISVTAVDASGSEASIGMMDASSVLIERVTESSIHGHETAGSTTGVVPVYKLTLRQPPIGAGLDWAITIRW